MTIVADPVGSAGVAALYVKLLVTVTVQEMVSPAVVPVLLHSVTPVDAALAGLAALVSTTPNSSPSPKANAAPSATKRSQPRNPARIFIRSFPLTVRSGATNQEQHGSVRRSLLIVNQPLRSRVPIASIGTWQVQLEAELTVDPAEECPSAGPGTGETAVPLVDLLLSQSRSATTTDKRHQLRARRPAAPTRPPSPRSVTGTSPPPALRAARRASITLMIQPTTRP